MTIKKSHLLRNFTLITLGLLTVAHSVNAANFDSMNESQSSFEGLEKSKTSESPTENTSILNSFQQSEANSKRDRYFEVLNLVKQNKLDDAQNKVSGLLKQSPNEPQFYNLQALLDGIKNNNTAAQQSYQKALDLDKNNLTAHLGLAKFALDANDFNGATDHANKVLAINDKLISAYLVLADVAYKQKNTAEVEKILLTGQEKIKGDITQEIEYINTLGKFYASQKQPEKLLTLAEDLVNRYPDKNQALSVLAGAQIANARQDLAEETLQKIIKNDPRDINHRLLLVKLMNSNSEKEKEVLQLLDDTIKIDPKNPQPSVFKIAYLIKLNRHQEALALTDALEKQFPKTAIGKLLKGDISLSQKQWDKALDYFQQAYKIEPNAGLLIKMADVMQAQGKPADAIALLDAESAKDNKNTALHFKLAALYQQQSNTSQAQLHYEAILNQQANNALAMNNLAWLYSQQNNPKGLELAKKAYELAPNNAAIADTYGYILLKQGQPKDALSILEKATTISPKDNDMQFHLAEAYAANENKSKATEILESIVKSEQAFSEKAAAEKLLAQLKSN